MSLIKTIITTTLLFFVSFLINAQSWNEIEKQVAEVRDQDAKYGNTVDLDAATAIIGTLADDLDEDGLNPLTNAGAAFINNFEDGQWIQHQKLIASDRDANANFGNDVSLSGDYALVGAYSEMYDENGENAFDDAGAAYIFERDVDGNWMEVQKLVASDRDEFNYFGSHVAISGNYAVVSAPNNGTDVNNNNFLMNSGSIYVFERDEFGVWTQVYKLTASDRGTLDFFGSSLDISGNYILVGSRGDDEDFSFTNYMIDAGSAYIFNRDSFGTWYQSQKISASDREPNDWFGISVSIDADQLIVGARQEDEAAEGGAEMNDAGSAYIFEKNDSNTWIESQKITPTDRAMGDLFGFDVSIHENKVLVSSRSDDEDENDENYLDRSGSAYIFEKDNTETWNETQKIVASDRTASDFFGTALAIYGNSIVVGSRGQDGDLNNENFLEDAGAIYYFTNCEIVETADDLFICSGDSIFIGGEFRYEAGEYVDILNTSEGCDSIVTYTLSVGEVINSFEEIDLCEGDEYVSWPGVVITEGGSYLFEEETFEGCFNTYAYEVTEFPIIVTNFSEVICEGDSVLVNGEYVFESGEFTASYGPSSLGCDSLVVTTVEMIPTIVNEINLTSCEGGFIEYNDLVFTADFNLEEIYETSSGCDSLVIVTGVFNPAFEQTVVAEYCEGETVMINGEEITQSGEYIEEFQTVNGCDSIIFYDLTFHTLPLIDLGADITICDTVEFYLDPGTGFVTYEWSDGSEEPTLLVQESDTYSVIVTDNNDCQGTDEVIITVDDCSLVEEFGNNTINVLFSQNSALISSSYLPIESIIIIDIQGRIIENIRLEREIFEFNFRHLSSGSYLLVILTDQEKMTRKFIKP